MARRTGQIQTAAKIVLKPIFRFAWRVRTEGLENVPSSGSAIIAPNHTSVLDSFFVPLVLRRRITYVGKAEYMDDWKTKLLFPAMGMIPIDRSGGDASQRALDASARILESGELFGIYPEGTRSHDGRLYRGKTGVARLALETGVPVIPVAVLGTDVVAPPGKKFGTFTRPGVRFGKPLDFSRYEGMENDRYILRSITDEIMYEIMRLSGQEYVDMYAAKAKDLEKERAKQAADEPPAENQLAS